MADPKTKQVSVVAGVGPGTGAALSGHFSKEYDVALMARSGT